MFLEQRTEPGVTEVLDRLDAAGARVVAAALAAHGTVEPLTRFHEAARAVLRAMPPILGPGNAMLRRERHLDALARDLSLDPQVIDEAIETLPWNDILPLDLQIGTYGLTWDGGAPWREHRLLLRVEQGALCGAVSFDERARPDASPQRPHGTQSAAHPTHPHALGPEYGFSLTLPGGLSLSLEWSPVAQSVPPSPEWDLLGTLRRVDLADSSAVVTKACARWLPR